ncbi:transposase [Tepidimonas fonticaldi]|nr:transposase [Tepidimonas fonticaldi]
MRGTQNIQGAMFSYISLEERVPARHPLRELRGLVDALLANMSAEFEAVYARRGRPSVPPEMLLKALLLQILFSIRSERLLVEAKAKHSAIGEAFGWIKTVGGLAKTKLIGHAKLAGQALMCFAAYNLVRMGSVGGWWDAHHV